MTVTVTAGGAVPFPPGVDPVELQQAARAYSQLAKDLGRLATDVKGSATTAASGWLGDAASAFLGKMGKRQADVAKVSKALEGVDPALTGEATALTAAITAYNTAVTAEQAARAGLPWTAGALAAAIAAEGVAVAAVQTAGAACATALHAVMVPLLEVAAGVLGTGGGTTTPTTPTEPTTPTTPLPTTTDPTITDSVVPGTTVPGLPTPTTPSTPGATTPLGDLVPGLTSPTPLDPVLARLIPAPQQTGTTTVELPGGRRFTMRTDGAADPTTPVTVRLPDGTMASFGRGGTTGGDLGSSLLGGSTTPLASSSATLPRSPSSLSSTPLSTVRPTPVPMSSLASGSSLSNPSTTLPTPTPVASTTSGRSGSSIPFMPMMMPMGMGGSRSEPDEDSRSRRRG